MARIRLAMLTGGGEDLAPILERTKGYVDDLVTHSEHYSEGMGTLRNRLLEKALVGMADGDYLLMLDPDEIPDLEFPDVELTESVYSATYVGGGETWEKPTLLRVGTPAVWRRSVHEYLETPTQAVLLEGYHVEQPFSSSSRERQEWKVTQLLTEIDDPRSVYYLAQTYDCLGLKGEAMRWYLFRSYMGGFEEERWHALYKAACDSECCDYQMARVLFERCIAQRPGRPEGYYRLARLLDYFGDHAGAWATVQAGAAQPPSTDELFVNRWMQDRLREMATRRVGHIFDGQDETDDEWAKAMKDLDLGEGTIGDEQAKWLGDFVRDRGPITVAETGFGLGRSAWAILEANPDAEVVSFDLGDHPAVMTAWQRLYERFGARTSLYYGDSKKTVPQFIDDHAVDVAIIDGGHDYDTAIADIIHMRVAGREVIFDDLVDQPWAEGCVRAWNEAVDIGLVIEKERHGDGHRHTWAVGIYT